MAYANPQFGYHQHPSEVTINSRRPSYFEEEDSGVLDPAILDTEIMSSPDTQIRRDSHANSNAVLSPSDSNTWDQHYGNGLASEPNSAGLSNTFREEHNGFVRPTPPHVQTFVGHPHPQGWTYDHSSGHCTPTTAVDFLPQHPPPQAYDGSHEPQYGAAHGTFIHPAPHPPMSQQQFHPHAPSEVPLVPAPQVQTPMSPHSHAEWMAMAQHEVEGRPMPKRMRHFSPPRTSVDMQRTSGIRKKNGRIEIPNERNIQTIDNLIENASDEDTLKELKQQKRLLRNREAALASRQRKKKHTEDLEHREKEFTQTCQSYDNHIQELSIKFQNLERNHQILRHNHEALQRTNESLQEESREMQLRHNEETSNLRRRLQFLNDQVDHHSAPAMSAVPSSTGFADPFSGEFEALNMGDFDTLDSLIHFDDLHNSSDDFFFDVKPEPVRQSPVMSKKTSSTAAPPAAKKPGEDTNDQPVASGLLFFLLLCGAFVASKPSNSRAAELPEVPEDVRAAAPAVLENLLSDATPVSMRSSSRIPQHQSQEPMSSSMPPSRSHPGGRMGMLHRTLTSPTRQQEFDQVFSLTTAQFASISNHDLTSQNEHGTAGQHHTISRQRPNLAEVLAKRQEEHMRTNKAEVYTRSLLWDQIPEHVVRQFKELVRDHNEIEARQQQEASHDDDDVLAYKVET